MIDRDCNPFNSSSLDIRPKKSPKKEMQEGRIIVGMKGSREIERRDMSDQIKASCQTRRSRIDIRFANFYKLLQTLHAVAALNDKRGRCLGQIITKAH